MPEQQQHQPSTEGGAGGSSSAAAGTTTDSNNTENTPANNTATGTSETPKARSKPKAVVEEEPELDDFGLPVFKPSGVSLHFDSSDGEEDEVRSDAGRDRRDDEASSRTTGSPVREVEEKEDSGTSIGERMIERMSLEVPVAAAPVAVDSASSSVNEEKEKEMDKEEQLQNAEPIEEEANDVPMDSTAAPRKVEALVIHFENRARAHSAASQAESIRRTDTPPPMMITKEFTPLTVAAAASTAEKPDERIDTVPEPRTEESDKTIVTAPTSTAEEAAKPADKPPTSKTEEPPAITATTTATSKEEITSNDSTIDAKTVSPKKQPPKPITIINPSSITKSDSPKTTESPREPSSATRPSHNRTVSISNQDLPSASPITPITPSAQQPSSATEPKPAISSWSHQQSVPEEKKDEGADSRRSSGEWQEMPSYAPYDIYNDEGKLIAKEHHFSEDEEGAGEDDRMGGASKGYTRVQLDEDAQSATSMDDNTKYLFKEPVNEEEDDEEGRNPLSQLETTKDLLTEGQRIAYVGLCKLAMMEMRAELEKLINVKKRWPKKSISIGREHMKMWSQIIMVRLYKHMDISPDEQIMIEQLSEHGLMASDLTGTLMKNARVKNPMAAEEAAKSPTPTSTPNSNRGSAVISRKGSTDRRDSEDAYFYADQTPPPAYEEKMADESVKMPSELPDSKTLDIDIRWTVLCDLFLVLISDSVYDARSRVLLELVGKHLSISWIDICKFEKKVTDALEMQESATQNWNESDILEDRAKRSRNKRYAMMGLATLGGGIVIGLSAGLLAPVIGAGLAAGFTTIGITTTGAFLGGTGGAALITTTAAISGSAIAGKAAGRRTQNVSVFEFRPLYNNKRVNLIVTISGWMNGKEDDVRLPYSTVDPIMGDIYSVLWEPEMMQSMGQTINILATEVLTQSLQQVLGSTVLMALMASLQVPMILTKLSYLLDNPWNVSLDRAWASGLILADTLMHRNLGVRPITLVGFSLGARVIFSCLRELARRNAHGLVQNVYMFGSPVVVNRDEYMAISGVVRGKFVNGYCTKDWILGYLFRATSGGIGRVAGLAPIENITGIDNVDCTEFVEGHMSYRTAIPKLLKKVDWVVLADEFSEIEEADPDQLRERQTELISEIEAARKDLEKEPTKRKWGLFGKNKDVAKKAEWETYAEEKDKPGNADGAGAEFARDGDVNEDRDNVLFDVEAIRRELALQEIEDKERAKEEKERKDAGGVAGGLRPPNVTAYNTSATPSLDIERNGQLNLPKSRPGTANTKPGSSTGVSTPNSGYATVQDKDKSPAGTARTTRTFSFGIFGGRKDSADKALVGSQAASRNSSVMDLSSKSLGYSQNHVGGSSPDLSRVTPQKAQRPSSGSLEPKSPWAGYSYEDEFGHDDGGRIQMTFEDSKFDDPYDDKPPPVPSKHTSPQKRAVSYWGQSHTSGSNSLQVRGTSPGLSSNSGTSSPRVSYDGRNEWGGGNAGNTGGGGALPVLNKSNLGVPQRKSSLGYYSPNSGYQMRSGSEWGNSTRGSASSGHGLLAGGSASGPSGVKKDKPLPHNPWNEEDEEEFGHEKEMTLSFE